MEDGKAGNWTYILFPIPAGPVTVNAVICSCIFASHMWIPQSLNKNCPKPQSLAFAFFISCHLLSAGVLSDPYPWDRNSTAESRLLPRLSPREPVSGVAGLWPHQQGRGRCPTGHHQCVSLREGTNSAKRLVRSPFL